MVRPEDVSRFSNDELNEIILEFLKGLEKRIKETESKAVPMSKRQPPRLSTASRTEYLKRS